MGRFSRWRKRRRVLDPDEIVASQPFGDRLRIRSAERIPGRKEFRRSALRVTADDGRRFKLRLCASRKQARAIETLVLAIPDALPAFFGREGRYLLFEWLEGYRPLDGPALALHAQGLGRMCATVNQHGAASGPLSRVFRKLESIRTVRNFRRELDLLRRLEWIDETVYEHLGELFSAGLRECGTPVCLELRDLHPGNLMVNEEGDVRYVDELGLGRCMRGLGVGKLLGRTGTEVHWHAFRKGYAEMADAGTLTPEYFHFVRIIAGVHAAAHKVHDGTQRPKLQSVLESLIEGSVGQLGDILRTHEQGPSD
jgi:hypothetical protein